MIWFVLIYIGSVILGTLVCSYYLWKYDKIVLIKDS